MSTNKSDRDERIAKGWQLIESEAYPEAETLFLDLVREVEAELGEEAPELIKPLCGYAKSIDKQHPWKVFHPKEREALERVLRLTCRVYGEDSVPASRVHETLATSLACSGEHELAIQHMEIVVRIQEPILGEGILLAHNLSWLARMYEDFGQYAKALSIYERAFAMAGGHGHDHADYEMNFAQGRVLFNLGRYADALPFLERVYAWFLNTYGLRNRVTHYHQEWVDSAREWLTHEPDRSDRDDRVAKGWELIWSEAHPEAEALFLDLVREVEAQFGEEAPELIQPLYGYARSMNKQPPWDVFHPKEREALERALHLACRAYGEESPQAIRVRDTLVYRLTDSGEYELAIQHLEIAVRVKGPILGEGILLAHHLNWLARLHADLGQHAKALSIYERAFAMAGDRGHDHADYEMNLGRGKALLNLGRHAEAIPLLERAYAWCFNKYGLHNRWTVDLQGWLDRAREGLKNEPTQ